MRTEAPVLSHRGRCVLHQSATESVQAAQGRQQDRVLTGMRLKTPSWWLSQWQNTSHLQQTSVGADKVLRRWWLTLHYDWTQQGWRSCVGILRYHVDDLMFAGNESDALYLSALETIRGLYHWSNCVAAVFSNNQTETSRLSRLNMLVPFKSFPSQHTDDDINTMCSLDGNIAKSSRNEVNSDGWRSRS